MHTESCLIDDFGPLPVVVPTTVAALGTLIRQAQAEERVIYPVGGRTMIDVGLPPMRDGTVVDLRSLDQVIDYPARDMTITVQSGITLETLQAQLRRENQRLPVDVPLAERATLGGALAVNVSGPRRLGHGTFRDYVIGISMVNDEGSEFKAGGRVVKNVAGYDICKLAVGSLGTLGIITQVTLKVRPLPEEQALVILSCDGDPEPILDLLHRSRTEPVCLELLNRVAGCWVNRSIKPPLPEREWLIIVGYEHNREAVSWQVQQLMRELPEAGRGTDVRLSTAAEPLWQRLIALPAEAEARLVFKANVLPSAVAGFCRQAVTLLPSIGLQAHAGNGIIVGRLAEPPDLAEIARHLTALRESAVADRGNLMLLRCPAAWKKTLPVWGAPRGDLVVMSAIKQKLDPRCVFNPGRFVDGMC